VTGFPIGLTRPARAAECCICPRHWRPYARAGQLRSWNRSLRLRRYGECGRFGGPQARHPRFCIRCGRAPAGRLPKPLDFV